MTKFNIDFSKIDFQKMDGLVPAVVQDVNSLQVLMVGFMNKEALEKTLETGKATFFSRTKQRLWTKGEEESGNFLYVKEVKSDCDNDTLLILVDPVGETCHLGQKSCFGTEPTSLYFLSSLEQVIRDRKKNLPQDSYTTELFSQGLNRIAQKVGEEAVETVISALAQDKEKFVSESADLLFHWLVLLEAKESSFKEVLDELQKRS